MTHKEIPEKAIESVAKLINDTVKFPSKVSVTTIQGETETPHYFEITPFSEIDTSERNFYAIDGSYNFQEFYNGICIGLYTAGYICYYRGKQVKLNNEDNPIINGKSYAPQNIMITNDKDKEAIFDELFSLDPVKKLLAYLGNPTDLWAFASDFASMKTATCESTSKLYSFCQTLLEWSLIYEIANLDKTKVGDFILRDGNLRPLEFKQKYIKELGKFLHDKGIILVSITKNSAIKLHLSSTFKTIDDYLQEDLKYKFEFAETDERKRKICCWLEVSDYYLEKSFKNDMIRKKDVKGGRGFGLYFIARLDYVEKLQNYDWVVADLNIYDAIPNIENGNTDRDIDKISEIFKELTRLSQEHYILGYPYPLAEVHNFVTLKSSFKQEIINRVKISLYRDTKMEHVDIENLFLDIHDRF
jgi:NurA domain